MSAPAISVVMPIYNGQDYLIDAIASVVEQSFEQWEMICVNDGSSDQSPEILNWFRRQDSRIRVVHQSNAGIVEALNLGCRLSQAPLILRMDSDDIAMPNRMEIQLAYMQSHPDCVVCGGAIQEMDACGDPLGVEVLPSSHREIITNLLHRRTGHFHPTTLIRSDALRRENGYRSRFQWVEDHELWLRISRHGKLANLSEVVLWYRQHAASVCWQRATQQRELMNELLRQAYREREMPVPEGVILEQTIQRTQAGPGKWARAASRRGYATTAFKHLRRLNQGNDSWAYKLRMNCEVFMRLGARAVSGGLAEGQHHQVPRFDDWHSKWAKDQGGRKSRQAA